MHGPFKEMVDENAEDDRSDDDLRDGDHHFLCRDVNPLTGQPEREKRRHNRRENGGRHRHRDGECDIAAREVGHDIGRRTAGTGADEDNACRKFRREGEGMCQRPCEERHDAELCDRTDEYVTRALEDKLKIRKAERHTHAEHDDAEQDRDPRHCPNECPRLKKGDARDENDE